MPEKPLTAPRFTEPKAFKKQALIKTIAPPKPKPKVKQNNEKNKKLPEKVRPNIPNDCISIMIITGLLGFNLSTKYPKRIFPTTPPNAARE